jgi:FkbM family methyltransferase
VRVHEYNSPASWRNAGECRQRDGAVGSRPGVSARSILGDAENRGVMGKIANTAALLKWWVRQLPVVMKVRTTPRRARWHLLSIDVPGGLASNWNIWAAISPAEFRLQVGEGAIWFAAEKINGDRGTFGEVFVEQCYSTDYLGATVLDIGAHKGYFGAYALASGAQAVLSYEPENENFAALERAAESFRAQGYEWRTTQAAVGSHAATAQLNLSRSSWTHSLRHAPELDPTGRVQDVAVIPFRDLIEEAAAFKRRLIVKIDVEGSECEVVLETAPDLWTTVDELFIEMHSFAPCSTEDVVAHIPMEVASADGLLHLLRPRADIPEEGGGRAGIPASPGGVVE